MRNNPQKYHNEKATRMVNGVAVAFDSRKEARRYDELRLLQRAGAIRDLEMQKRFRLIPAQRDKNGKVIERQCDYVADFCFWRIEYL